MNSTECCKTIGCNCAGTINIEAMSHWQTYAIVIPLAIIMLWILLYLIPSIWRPIEP